VREFVYELNELSMMVGSIDERARVNRLWYGCNHEIQRELWMRGLNPELSDFETVATTAETVELASGVAERRNTGPKAENQSLDKRKGNNVHHTEMPRPYANKGAQGKSGHNGSHAETRGRQDDKKPFQKKSISQKGALTEKERDELRTEGKCFICRGAGHMARNCPQRNTINATGKSGQAPGIRNNAIRLGGNDLVQLEQLADATESIESLTLGSMVLPSGSETESFDDLPDLLDGIDSELDSESGNDSDAGSEDSDDETEVEINYTNGQPGAAPTEQRRDGTEGLPRFTTTSLMEDPIGARIEFILEASVPYAGDGLAPHRDQGGGRFVSYQIAGRQWLVWDSWWVDTEGEEEHFLSLDRVLHQSFNVAGWYHKIRKKRAHPRGPNFFDDDDDFPGFPDDHTQRGQGTVSVDPVWATQDIANHLEPVWCCSQRFGDPEPATVQRNAARLKGFTRKVPRPVVVIAKVNGHPTRALLDSGSLGDFMSTTLADQLKVEKIPLEKPLPVQLAVQGSRTRANYGTKVNLQYQGINSSRYFDIINLDGYDLILGTPFMYQHKVSIGLNDPRVMIGSSEPLPMEGENVAVLTSRAIDVLEEQLEAARQELRDYSADICKKAMETALPPLRKINHRIPLIDPDKAYPWRPSRVPEALRGQWATKRDAYLATSRWQMATGSSACPMLLIKKPALPGDPPKLRTVVDLRERNANTKKMASPLPDIHTLLSRVASKRYRSLMDGQDAYEQIRVEPCDVPRTLMTTPDGTMISNVLQLGDANGVATFMAVMTDLFLPYLGVWMDVYLDDIIVYSDTLEEHVQRVKFIMDTLRKARFYLAADKLHFLPKELKLLGHVITDDGIKLDPYKVDSVVAWKTPTSRDALRRFLGSVGYLTSNLSHVRIPMGILSALTGEGTPFRWTYTEQRAFDEIRNIVGEARDLARVAIDYSPGAPPINLVTDGCSIGIAGCISQGGDWRTAPVVTFYSAKLSSAQQNYAVHEIELLAGVETMVRYRHLLLGTRFCWYTDHKGLIYVLKQKGLTGRQARWMEKLSEFDFEVIYVPGEQNTLADALSRVYSDDKPGTVRAPSEYTSSEGTMSSIPVSLISMPLLVGAEAVADSLSIRTITADDGPETGCPETAKEFSKRIKRVRLTLRSESGQEGGKKPETDKTADVSQAEPQNRAQGISSGLEGQLTQESLAEGIVNPPLIDVVASDEVGFDFPASLKGRYAEDSFFSHILEKPRDHKNFEVKDGLIFLNGEGQMVLCIPSCTINGRNVREIIISHAHSILAHLGSQKTIAYLRDQVWWKEMNRDITRYCETCSVCKRSKPDNQRPYGLLNPLSVPSRPWESIGIDFVGPLPLSKNRNGEYDMIAVIIDRLTSMVHLVPGRQDYKARDMAELVFAEVYRLHGLPKSIVSDRDTLFTSTFWTHLHRLIGVELKMSSAYHPQTDGATERANRTITQMLRQCVRPDQKDWVAKLPAVEFAINAARSDTTGYAPFFLNSGRMPRSFVWNKPDAGEYPGVRTFAQKMHNAVMAAHDSIIEARAKQTRSANRQRRPAPFTEGDLVYISTKNLSVPKGRARKLVPKYIGPYRVLKDFGNSSFRIELPANLKSRGLHNVFHASLLRIHSPNDDRLFPGRLDNQVEYLGGTEGEWMIERIRAHAGQGSGALFEVLWKSGDVTWLPYEQIAKSTALEDYLESQGAQGIRSLPRGSGKPPKDLELIISMVGWKLEETLGGFKADEDQTTHRIHPHPMQYTNNRHLKRAGPHFLLQDPLTDKTRQLSASHVREILSFDRLLRAFKHGSGERPTNYDRIAEVFNHDILCTEKLARLTITNAGNASVVVPGPSPTFNASDATPQPRSPTSERFGHRALRDDPELIRAARAILNANDKSLRRKTSQTHREKRRQPLQRAPELDTYSVAGPSSGPHRVSRLDVPIERVPGHAYESEVDAIMGSEAEVAGEDVFDADATAPADDANVEDPAEYE
jgi:transposase InsO family protein